MSLESVLDQLKIPAVDKAELLAEYGTLDADTWNEELEIIAMAFQIDQPPSGEPLQCSPWREMWEEMVINGKPVREAISEVTIALPPNLSLAVSGLITSMAAKLGTNYQRLKIGSRFSAARARRLGNPLINPPDPKLQDALEDILTPVKGVTASVRYSNSESLLLTWLDENGKFIQTPEGDLYYLWQEKHRLFELDTERWHAWLHELTGINPASKSFAVFSNACKTAAILNSEVKRVVRLAYYDEDTHLLWVSRFDGKIYCLNGTDIKLHDNGDAPVIFDDLFIWEPYDPDFINTNNAAEIISSVANWEEPKHAWAYQVWTQSLFFNELCPTKPIMVLLGEKGSGKSMTLRILLRLLFGQWSQVSGVPTKPDDFSVTASHYHLYAMDNLDSMEPWLQDKLARISTGAMDEYRKLYTSKEMGILKYRCWIAVTARTPDVLRRDDLADRLLILPLNRISDDERRRESLFLNEIDELRNSWWGDILTNLNAVVRELQNGGLPSTSELRMADWEALGRVMSIQSGKLDLWEEIVKDLKRAQNNFLADGEIVIEAIDTWLNSKSSSLMNSDSNVERWVTARELYTEAQQLLFNGNKPDSDWPRSVKAFSRRLNGLKSVLENRYDMISRISRGNRQYMFLNN